jgi:NAD(P)H-hydrate epimerase
VLGKLLGKKAHRASSLHHETERSGPVVSASSAPTNWPHRDASHLLVSSAEMAELENQLFASGLPVEALMEKAALAVSRRLLEQYGEELRQRGALVLVGPGHNGGDGLVVARELHLAGVAVRIWSPFERHKPLTERHLQHARWLGIAQLTDPPEPSDPALWIDALLGIGQKRAAGETVESVLEQRQVHQRGRLVAIDVPTGLCADTGTPFGAGVARACQTYAIGLLKQGLIQDAALAWVGRLERIDLGLPARLLDALPSSQPLALRFEDLDHAPWPQGDPAASKYQRGRLLVVAGSDAYRGAAHLTLAGARASGCGSVRAALPPAIASGLWTVFPEVVVQELACGSDGELDLAPLDLSQLERLDTILLGPGLGAGTGAELGPAAGGAEGRIWEQVQAFAGLLVLDADGLNRLAQANTSANPRGARRWLEGRRGATWITPHPVEFQRLFPDLMASPPLESAAAAAQHSGATVLLKGARSVVAAPDGRRWQLMSAEPRAARAGLGDVLAGYAAGLGARQLASMGQTPPHLLALATTAHAEAGHQAARRGDSSPIAVAQHLQRSEAEQHCRQ